MIPKTFTEEIHLKDGRKIILETGKLAKQAHGSVMVKTGNCMLLCTVVSNYNSAQVDFLPLTVDYREKFASAGRYPGGFFKREARPSDGEILTMRLVDRVLRPLFPSDYHNEVQVMIQLMSNDPDVMPDALAGLAAGAYNQYGKNNSGVASREKVGHLISGFKIREKLAASFGEDSKEVSACDTAISRLLFRR